MVSPGQLQLLTALADGSLAEFEPTIDPDSGEIDYPEATRLLYGDDGPPFEVLESLAARGILDKEFKEKAYICPGCGTEGMRFTTTCPSCGSPHTVETELFEHLDCGHVDSRAAFEVTDGTYVCPGCEETLQSFDHTERGRRHVCQDCGEYFERPDPALACRECPDPYAPEAAIERVLCRYRLSEEGERWVESQLGAREAAVETLRERGFDVSANTRVTGASGASYPVHVYAEDELFDSRMIAAIHEHPSTDATARLRDVAADADANAMLVTTLGSVGGQAATLADESDISILTARDGGLRRNYEVSEARTSGRTLVQRLTSAVKQ